MMDDMGTILLDNNYTPDSATLDLIPSQDQVGEKSTHAHGPRMHRLHSTTTRLDAHFAARLDVDLATRRSFRSLSRRSFRGSTRRSIRIFIRRSSRGSTRRSFHGSTKRSFRGSSRRSFHGSTKRSFRGSSRRSSCGLTRRSFCGSTSTLTSRLNFDAHLAARLRLAPRGSISTVIMGNTSGSV
jgi:hypothetical protein